MLLIEYNFAIRKSMISSWEEVDFFIVQANKKICHRMDGRFFFEKS